MRRLLHHRAALMQSRALSLLFPSRTAGVQRPGRAAPPSSHSLSVHRFSAVSVRFLYGENLLDAIQTSSRLFCLAENKRLKVLLADLL
jgi:hypothetical protein